MNIHKSILATFGTLCQNIATLYVTGGVVQIWTTQDYTNDDGIFRLSTWLF